MNASESKKSFTIDEANRMIPTLRDKVGIIRDRLEWMNAHKPQLEFEVEEHGIPCEAPVPEDYFASLLRVRTALGELDALGCQLKDIRMGTVDFPSRLFGREVLLCWCLGEDTVGFYHDPRAGFAGRQPIPADSGKSPAGPGDPQPDEGH